MLRTQPYLEKSEYIQINLDTPIALPGNNQAQTKSGYKFTLKDPSQARLCYCFDPTFAIKLLVEHDKTSTVQLVKI